MKALSLRQPWAHAVIHGGKRIENRLKWKASKFRGPLLIHASQGMRHREYDDVKRFIVERKITTWSMPYMNDLQRGGIIGICNVIGVVLPRTRGFVSDEEGPAAFIGEWPIHKDQARPLTALERAWWMGEFALVLDDVKPLPFVPCKGALGFFGVPKSVLAELPL